MDGTRAGSGVGALERSMVVWAVKVKDAPTAISEYMYFFILGLIQLVLHSLANSVIPLGCPSQGTFEQRAGYLQALHCCNAQSQY